MNLKITLPYGGKNAYFDIQELVKYIKEKQLSYIIIGSSHLSYAHHKKKHSLDVCLRKYATKGTAKDTCQSVNSVIKQILSTGLFELSICKCPKTNRNCKALIYIKSKYPAKS
jgi:hypothetical protein